MKEVSAKFEVFGYEVGSASYGLFETFSEAKAYAEHLKFTTKEDFSVIDLNIDGVGSEVFTTKEQDR